MMIPKRRQWMLTLWMVLLCWSLLSNKSEALPRKPSNSPASNNNKRNNNNQFLFDREYVVLDDNGNRVSKKNNSSSDLKQKRQMSLLKLDAVIGIVYATGFFLFPSQTLSLFFNYELDPSMMTFWKMMVRIIAINHLGYIAGLLTAPTAKAIQVATAFETIGGIFVVLYSHAKLETAAMFWTCTILTALMIVAHLLVL